jgi:ATP-binding cassette subfamily B protein
VVPYLWPDDAPWVRVRVVAALGALILAKIIAVGTPFFYKAAVDMLAGDASDAADGAMLLALGAVGLTVAYGMARLLNVGFQQLRDVIFARVGQRALRSVAIETFTHIHRMSLRYHITRKTGGLSRITQPPRAPGSAAPRKAPSSSAATVPPGCACPRRITAPSAP